MKQASLLIFGFALSTPWGCATRQDSLQKKYPYARLTPDYGLLNEDDLWISEQNAYPVPLSRDSLAYPYWQCFPASSFTFSCNDLGKNDQGGAMADIEIRIESGNGREERYGGRRGLELSVCRDFLAKWKSLIQGEKYACISGLHPLEENQLNGQVRTWTYDRFKTSKGCVSYFDDYCDASYWRQSSQK